MVELYSSMKNKSDKLNQPLGTIVEVDALEILESGLKPSQLQLKDGYGSNQATAYPHSSLLRLGLVVAVCISWTITSSVAILVNKNVMVDVGFKYPTTVAWMGLLTTTTASFITMQLLVPQHQRQHMSLRYYMTRVMPTGFFMALTFFTGNSAYLYLTVAFVQMLKAFCPVVTMLLLFLVSLERATPRLIASVLLISCGVAMASYGEMHMSVVGLTVMLTSVVSESVRLVMTQHLLVGRSFHPFEGLTYISSACTFWLMIMALFLEWPQLYSAQAYLLVGEHPLKFLITAVTGFGVNALAILVIKLASSLTLKVLGTVKDAALVTVGVVFLHEVVSPLQLLGYTISLLGFVAYNVIKASSLQQGRVGKSQ